MQPLCGTGMSVNRSQHVILGVFKGDPMEASPLLFPVQVAQTDRHGVLLTPPNTRSVVYEIGCSDRDTLDEEWIDRYPRSLLISFEPVLEKYAALLARGNARYHGLRTDQAVPLAHHHQRGVVLPLAVAPTGGGSGRLSSLTIGVTSGCSSLVEVNQRAGWGHGCKSSLERRLVPSINMSAALGLSGKLPIKLLKIDAQGVDFKL